MPPAALQTHGHNCRADYVADVCTEEVLVQLHLADSAAVAGQADAKEQALRVIDGAPYLAELVEQEDAAALCLTCRLQQQK